MVLPPKSLLDLVKVPNTIAIAEVLMVHDITHAPQPMSTQPTQEIQQQSLVIVNLVISTTAE